MKLCVISVILFTVSACYAEFDTVKTQPSYADHPSYVHWPAPPPSRSVQIQGQK